MIAKVITALGDYGIVIVKHIVRLITITLGALGIVYIIGRMLAIDLSMKTKNIIATILMFLFSFCITIIYYSEGYSTIRIIWETFIFGAISCVLYVVFAWKLFARIDHFLDKKGFKD